EFTFLPGDLRPAGSYAWDIGSAGSTTSLCLALLPVLALTSEAPVTVELRGGVFQDGAPSYFHLAHVLLPLIGELGVWSSAGVGRPGAVPRGGGTSRGTVEPAPRLRALGRERQGMLRRLGASRCRHT